MQRKITSFSYLWSSFLISSVGDWLYRLTVPVIILNKTSSAYQAAASFGISFVPWIVFSLLGGSLADNYDKKKILVGGNLCATLASLLVLLILTAHTISFPLLYTAIFILASIDPLIHPSFQSIIPTIVPPERFASANAIIQTVDNTLSVLGPLLGGSLVTLLGGQHALWIDTGSFLLAAVLLLGLPTKTKVSPPRSVRLGISSSMILLLVPNIASNKKLFLADH